MPTDATGTAKVLIVDDEPQIRRFLKASLTAHGYQVVEAEDANSAIRAATVEKPDLTILDLGLPDMDGMDVIERVREWSTMPIIVLSVRSDESDKVGALDRGANDYITKPFGMAELMARMRAALRHIGPGRQRRPGAEGRPRDHRPRQAAGDGRRRAGEALAQGI